MNVAECGRWGGRLLAQNLLDLAEGVLPMNSPVGGVGRRSGEEKFAGVHFPDPGDVNPKFMNPVGPVGAWIARETLVDAVLIQHVSDGDLHVLLPQCGGSQWLALRVWFRYAVANGTVKVSMPGYQLRPNSDPRLFEQFIDGMDEGISSHKRCAELEDGWGALGSSSYPPPDVDAKVAIGILPLVELGRTRARHRLWRGVVTWDEATPYIERLWSPDDDVTGATLIALLGGHGIALVTSLATVN